MYNNNTMCGIFAFLSKLGIILPINRECFINNCETTKHRGPDNTKYLDLNENKLLFGFHRLAINDITSTGDQPLSLDNKYWLICNGEIYNHNELAQKYNLKTKGHSDCEIILHLYKAFGIKKTLEEISGYFAFALWDEELNKLIIARDPIGVRQLYIADDNESTCVCSEMKGIPISCNNVKQFPPGCVWENGEYTIYYKYEYPQINPSEMSINDQLVKIRSLFEDAVKKRFMFERPFGVFLSGGLDSSLVAALVAKQNAPKQIHSFSIGMAGSTDLAKARIVAEHISSIHHEVIVTPDDMLAAIPEVVKQIETWDTTTVRASVPMYLLSKYIKENTDIVVVFSGEGSDEASGSYLYFHRAPNDFAFQQECVRLLTDLCYFDCLRCDKSTAGNGLEVRVPFLDKEFIQEYMRVPAEWKRPRDGMEKWFIRKAFDGFGLLPDEILWRKKEAFSDGVSSTEKSWFQIIQDHVDSLISNEEFNNNRKQMEPEPQLKESYYYRKLFDSYYPGRANTIPYYWLPKWSGDTKDPSARVLSIYTELDKQE
jgi:asparagine synthase (glutamine-hydrolysing)